MADIQASNIPCLGSVIGDIVGSVYEFDNIKTTEFPIVGPLSHFTDDTVMTAAVAEWLNVDDPIKLTQERLTDRLVSWGKRYPNAGYGKAFYTWLFTPQYLKDYKGGLIGKRAPYYSLGDGSAMRCSACGWVADRVEQAMELAEKSALPTHNHPEAIRGAKAVAAAIYIALHGATKEEITQFIETNLYYDLHRHIEDIRDSYKWEIACQNVVPEAIIAFLDSTDFESAIRLAVSLGGDSDTIACITGGIAQAFYKDIPDEIVHKTVPLIDDEILIALCNLIDVGK